MRNIVTAAILAAGLVASPVAIVTSSSVLAVDCSNPDDPGNRPGGYCKLVEPGSSLSAPVTGNGDCSIFYREVDATDYIPLVYGERVLVAVNIPEACQRTE